MKKRKSIIKNFLIQTPLPSRIFFYTFLVFNFLPSLYLFATNYYEGLYGVANTNDYYTALNLNFIIIIVFGLFYLTFRYLFKLFLKTKSKNSNIHIRDKEIVIISSNESFFISKKMYNWVIRFGIFGAIVVWVYLLLGGYEKLLLCNDG